MSVYFCAYYVVRSDGLFGFGGFFVQLLRLSMCPYSSDFSLYCSYIQSLCYRHFALTKLFFVPRLLMKMLKTR